MIEPTDAEIFVVAREAGLLPDNSHPAPETRVGRKHSNAVQAFARAVLARWGQPAHSGDPVAWRIHPFDYGIGSQGVYAITSLPQQRDAWLRRGWKAEPLYTTPQPTRAGAVESAEFDQFLSDVLTAAGLVAHGKQCKALGERLADMCMKLRLHGIKGGQHGTDT